MPTVTFHSFDGTTRTVEASDGESVMSAATSNGVPDITGECGGVLSCATCHVFVSESDLDRVAPMSSSEDEMLEGTAVDRTSSSRLSCQLIMSDELDGLEVTTPEYQE